MDLEGSSSEEVGKQFLNRSYVRVGCLDPAMHDLAEAGVLPLFAAAVPAKVDVIGKEKVFKGVPVPPQLRAVAGARCQTFRVGMDRVEVCSHVLRFDLPDQQKTVAASHPDRIVGSACLDAPRLVGSHNPCVKRRYVLCQGGAVRVFR